MYEITARLDKIIEQNKELIRLSKTIIHQNVKIMSQQDQIDADVQAISDAVNASSADVAAIAQEISDLKNTVAPDQTALISKLDDLSTRATAVKTALDAIVPAPVATPVTAPVSDAPPASDAVAS